MVSYSLIVKKMVVVAITIVKTSYKKGRFWSGARSRLFHVKFPGQECCKLPEQVFCSDSLSFLGRVRSGAVCGACWCLGVQYCVSVVVLFEPLWSGLPLFPPHTNTFENLGRPSTWKKSQTCLTQPNLFYNHKI